MSIGVGYDRAVTRFFYLKVVVDWDETLEDHSLPDGGKVNVVSFGWMFNVVDLHYFDPWGEPPLHERGTFSQTVRAMGDPLNILSCVCRLQVLNDQRGEYVAQIFGTHSGVFLGKSISRRSSWPRWRS